MSPNSKPGTARNPLVVGDRYEPVEQLARIATEPAVALVAAHLWLNAADARAHPTRGPLAALEEHGGC